MSGPATDAAELLDGAPPPPETEPPDNEPVVPAGPRGRGRPRVTRSRARARTRTAPATPRPRGPSFTDLERQLADTTMMAAVGVLMASPQGRQTMSVEGVSEILEEQVGQFAQGWVAVAKENAAVARALEQLLTGGVWLNAGIQTVALAGLVTTLAGRPALPLPLVTFFVPKLRPLVTAPVQAEPDGASEA